MFALHKNITGLGGAVRAHHRTRKHPADLPVMKFGWIFIGKNNEEIRSRPTGKEYEKIFKMWNISTQLKRSFYIQLNER